MFWNPYAWAPTQGASPNFFAPWTSAVPSTYPMPTFRPPPGLGSLPSLPPLPQLPMRAPASMPAPAEQGWRVVSPPRDSDGREQGWRVVSPPRVSGGPRTHTPATTPAPAPTPATIDGLSPRSSHVSISGAHSRHTISATCAVPAPVLPAAHAFHATGAQRAALRADAHLPGAERGMWDDSSADDMAQVDVSDQSPIEGSDAALIDQPILEDVSLLSAASADDDLPPVLPRETTSRAGLLSVLSHYTDSVVSVEEPLTELSYAERALGRSTAHQTASHVRESPLVRRALTAARKRFLAPSAAEYSLSGMGTPLEESQLSQSVGLLAPPPGHGPCRSVNWQFTSFRPAGRTLHFADEEKARLGISRTPRPSVAVQEKSLRHFELIAQRGLATMGKMDLLLAALATATSDQDAPPSSESSCEDANQVLLSAMSDCIQHTADNLATLYLDAVLLRRDRILDASALPPAAKASARALPITQPYLFGSAAGQVVQDAAAQASSALALRASMAQATQRRRPPPSGAPPRKVPRRAAPAHQAPGQSPRPRPRPPARSHRQPLGQRRAPNKGKHPQ